MAVKKVKRQQQQYREAIEQPEMEVNDSRKDDSSMNSYSKQGGNDNLKESYPVFSSTTNTGGNPALERVISFQDDSIAVQRLAKIAEGVYDFRIDKITVREGVETQYGVKDQYVISFSLYSELTEQITKLSLPYNISMHQQSALMMLLGAFKEVFRGQKITMTQLIGLTGQARVHHVASQSGNVFEKIEILTVEKPIT